MSCILAPEQTQVPRRPQVPRRRVNNFQLANVMEPQSSPPTPTPAPAPGSNANILVDDSASNTPATRPASVAVTTQGAHGQYDCARQAPNPTGYPQAARGLNESVLDLGSASLGVVFARPDRTD
ncbi:hypothetical protein PCASD_22386 [Puccinia coronata f. sp. avenae]|uniref:Uncharacterized protein n=1 Tax=Puccinia coronata f. sp. avenae TaxID=200324 RepID=A0A2N5SEW6_9BASI|nr:hypothetical protein PCASD_22386 [Puccinia coronata f. sp. avenae]